MWWLFGCLQILLTASQTTFTGDQYFCKSWFHIYRMIFIQSTCNLTFEKSALVWPPVDASVGVYSELYSSVRISVEGSYFSRNRSSQKICLSCQIVCEAWREGRYAQLLNPWFPPGLEPPTPFLGTLSFWSKFKKLPPTFWEPSKLVHVNWKKHYKMKVLRFLLY